MASLQSPADRLNRDRFLASLERHIAFLARTPLEQLASPRVLAVDAKWGQGKSWTAHQLRERLRGKDAEASPVVLIDAFRYDHHDDPFAVIAAAIIDVLKPNAAKRKKYLAAAGQVLKSAAPLAVKALANVAIKASGIDLDDLSETAVAVKNAALEKSGAFSEKAVEKLFASYSKTQIIQDEFVSTLTEITAELPRPLVVIIDELDRCRPSFALEILERIKHLFVAENVVFLMFWNSSSIHESIRHTYGRETDAEAYLSKFIAYNLPLNAPQPTSKRAGHGYGEFIRAELTRTLPADADFFDFRDALTELTTIINPALRDLQKAIQLYVALDAPGARIWNPHYAYLLLLKSISESRFKAIGKLQRSAVVDELGYFDQTRALANQSAINHIFCILYYAREKTRLDTLISSPAGRSPVDAEVISSTSAGKRLTDFMESADDIVRDLTERRI